VGAQQAPAVATGKDRVREIVVDTETTGLDPQSGHRIVEIAAIELFHHVPTGRRFHCYVNPERDMPVDAYAVHGLTAEFLSTHPSFAEVVSEFLAFVGDDPLVIHNAEFDIAFLNAELARAGLPLLAAPFVDTLSMARRRFPGAPSVAGLRSISLRAISTGRRSIAGSSLMFTSSCSVAVSRDLTSPRPRPRAWPMSRRS